jgi:hypothetical protein
VQHALEQALRRFLIEVRMGFGLAIMLGLLALWLATR